MKYTLEVIAFDITSCHMAQKSGANRIELCDNEAEGGTTPSFGLIKAARSLVNIELFPIIRPRGGDFLYSDDEFDSMKSDLLLIKDLGYPGAVIGLLKKDGHIDIDRTAALVSIADNMEITFHRAFDRCIDPLKGLEDIIQTGCKRILTSGQVPHVSNALPLITQLVNNANGRITIMPGSGVRANNIADIISSTGVMEIHSSARKNYPSKMLFSPASMQEQMMFTGIDEAEIMAMKKAITAL